MGHGDPRVGRDRRGRRDPWNHLEPDAGGRQSLRLLTTAAEDERVAALKTDDPQPVLRQRNEEIADLPLRDPSAPTLADEEPLGVRWRLLDKLGHHETVVDERVAGANEVKTANRDQAGVSRARSDEVDRPVLHRFDFSSFPL
jgi:hypothetical protein